eukprot:TRINITY_DN815_c0_g3_i1.p1 TRINITY_DN815_c0_g3~~TRINITY_DN815_c0_g3_i1.p1  ORF type:complete len:394 (+),score=67.04 TRINITY_DN815_c0_g3_i1:520-1701(+)
MALAAAISASPHLTLALGNSLHDFRLPSAYFLHLWVARFTLVMMKVAVGVTSVEEVVPSIIKYLAYFVVCFTLKYSYKTHMKSYYSLSERIATYALIDFCLMSSGIGVLVAAVRPIVEINGLIVWTAGIVCGAFHTYQSITSNIAHWANDVCFWGRLFGLYHVLRLKEYSFQNLLFLRGLVLNYFKSIDNDDFTLFAETNSAPIFTSESPEIHRPVLSQIIQLMFDTEIKSCSDTYQLELLVLAKSQYLIEICHKSNTALATLTVLRTISATHEMYRHRLVRLVSSAKYLSEYKGRELVVLKFARDSGRLKELMKTQAMVAAKLWNYISTSQPPIATVDELVLECLRVRSEIKKLWKRIESYNISAPEYFRMCISYIELLCGDYQMEQKWKQL